MGLSSILSGKPSGEPTEADRRHRYYWFNKERAWAHSPEVVYGKDPAYLSIFDQILFEEAQDRVCILNATLDREIYALTPLIQSVIHFLRKSSNTELHILVKTESVLDTHPLLARLGEAGLTSRVFIGQLRDAFPDFNFIVADDTVYRFNDSLNTTSSSGEFGNPGLAARHKKTFRALEQKSDPISLRTGATGGVTADEAPTPS